MNKRRAFIPEAEPAVVFGAKKRVIIDNHVASKQDYKLSTTLFEFFNLNRKLYLSKRERVIK